jgi:VCBS repeat-containing protein
VDAISDRLMNRLQYRNFGDDQTPDQILVVNHTVDVDETDHAGVRWYELNNAGGGWTIAQEGTYAPDADHRWMGSAAMNGTGDIALGYSVSSSLTNPSIRYAGRLDGDLPLGEMTVTEGEIVAGAGYQTHSSGRWGDYSTLTVDPLDDCTFWYTQEYYAAAGNAPWRTRIGSFQLAACAPVNNDNASPVLAVNAGLTVGEGASETISPADLEVTDTDNTAAQIAFTVTAGPANGTVRLNGNATSSFTQDDIDNSRVSYLHDGGETTADSFDFAVSDGAGGSIAGTPFAITVNAVNDDPVLATNDGLTVANNAAGTITTSLLEVTDADNATGDIQYTITTLPVNGTLLNNASPVVLNGTFTQAEVDSGLISYLHDGSDTTADSFGFEFSDGIVANIGPNTFDITVTPVGGGTTVHVGNLDVFSTSSQGSTWSTTVTVTVHDSAEGVLAGALVSASWSGSGPGDNQCPTNGAGQCDLSHSGIHGKKTTLTIGNVTLAGSTYDAASNHVTSITVNKP